MKLATHLYVTVIWILYRKRVSVHTFSRATFYLLLQKLCVTMKSKQQAKAKLEAHIIAGQLTVQ